MKHLIKFKGGDTFMTYEIYKDPVFFAKTYFLEEIEAMTFKSNYSALPIIYFNHEQGIITDREMFLNHEVLLNKKVNNDFDQAFIYCPRAFRGMLLEWYFINDLFPNDVEKRKAILATRVDAENGFDNTDYNYIDFLKETATDKFDDIKEFYKIIEKKEIITIYRGVEDKSLQLDEIMELDFPCLISYTLDKKVGDFFANRYETGNGKLYKMEVSTNNIVAYDNSRNEQEVLICSEDVINMQLIE